MFGTIYVLTNPFLSFLCIDSIKALRFEPFAPIADNKAFKRLAFAISRFEVEGVRGFNNKYLMKNQAKASLFDIKQ